MPLVCPKCGSSIKALTVRSRFTCTSCDTKLVGYVIWPIFWACIFSALSELIIYDYIYSSLGDGWPAFLVRISISGVVLFTLWAIFVNKFGNIEVADEQTAKP